MVGMNQLAITAVVLPPGLQGVFAFRCGAVGFIGNNDICGGQLIAEIVIGDAFFIQSQPGVKNTEGRAQIDPRFVNRCGE